jgi:Tol biopolymer transport system component
MKSHADRYQVVKSKATAILERDMQLQTDFTNDLYVVEKNGKVSRLIELPGLQTDPNFIPNTNSIVFRSFPDLFYQASIRRVDSTGENLQTIVQQISFPYGVFVTPSITLDGRRIVYTNGGFDQGAGVFTIPINGGKSERIFGNRGRCVKFNADSTFFVFLGFEEGMVLVRVKDKQEINPGGFDYISSPVFHPHDPRFFAFFGIPRFDTTAGAGIYTARIDSAGEAIEQLKLIHESTTAFDVSFFPSGERLIYVEIEPTSQQYQIFSILTDGTDIARITTLFGASARQPTVSPIGGEIVFVMVPSESTSPQPQQPVFPPPIRDVGKKTPQIILIDPSTVKQNAELQLAVLGQNFSESSLVVVDTKFPETKYVSDTRLEAKLTTEITASTGEKTVKVHDVETGELSNPKTLTVE